jgi:predicted dehydrogenase
MTRIGVIGAGEIGRLRVRSVLECPDTDLAGVADMDAALATRAVAGTGAKTWVDYRALLDESRADAVIVSTPTHLHAQMVNAALEAGKHVLCEKPLAPSVDDCHQLLALSRRRQCSLAVGFNHRFWPCVKFLKQVLADGRIGTVDHLRVYGAHDGLHNFRGDWMFKRPASGGGAMMDVGIHMTDLARYIAGEIVEVYGIARNDIWRVEGSEDHAAAIFKTESGVPVIYQTAWTEWRGYQWYVDVYGDRGMVRAYYAPMFNMLITQDRPGAARRRSFKLYPEIIVREKLKGWQSTTMLAFGDELRDFLGMIAGKSVALADGWSGCRAVEIAAAVYESTTSGKPVRLMPPTMGIHIPGRSSPSGADDLHTP